MSFNRESSHSISQVSIPPERPQSSDPIPILPEQQLVFSNFEPQFNAELLDYGEVSQDSLFSLKPVILKQTNGDDEQKQEAFEPYAAKEERPAEKTRNLNQKKAPGMFDGSEFILKEVNFFEDQNKNTNFIKFVFKHFIKNFKGGTWNNNDQLSRAWKQLNKSVIKHIEKIGIVNVNRAHLWTLLGDTGQNPMSNIVNSRNRRLLSQMLTDGQFIEQNIFRKGYMKAVNKKQYLIACKVFALRCRSSCLITRVKTR